MHMIKCFLHAFAILLTLLFVHSVPSFSASLDGIMQNVVDTTYRVSFRLHKGAIGKFSYRFPVPSNYSHRSVSQKIGNMRVNSVPRPEKLDETRDEYGNRFKTIKWKDVSGEIDIQLNFRAKITSSANGISSKTPYPIVKTHRKVKPYLELSRLTADSSGKLAELVKDLTKASKTEIDAVESILNWVSSNIRYEPNTPRASAIKTLSTGNGNCEGYSNLTVAMLRIAGIPARVAGGLSLSRKWKTPTNWGYRIYDMGQGPHAWVEVYFPDAGWVPYDPQQKELIFSSRLIKFAHGLDSGGIHNSWSSNSYLPEYSEETEALFIQDKIDVQLK